jgi:hypothetical protein
MANELHPVNEDRADWATNALNTFTEETYGGRRFDRMAAEAADDDSGYDSDAYTAVQDLIGDLLHVAVRHGWDPEEIIRKAVANFDHENAPGYEGD